MICMENGILLVPLPTNATHILQPMDVGFFSQFKREWRDVIRLRQAIFPGESTLKNTVVCGLIKETIDRIGEASAKLYIMNGFREAGLVPFNPEMVLGG